MGSKQRYTVIGIVIMAILVALALSHGLHTIWVEAGWTDYPVVSREVTLTKLLAYAIALGAATFAIKHGPTFQLANEVVDELSKVTWPSREETGSATVVVIVTVVVCSLYLGVFDAMWLWLTDWLLGVPGTTAGM